MDTVLVVGGAGYIGSHCVYALLDKGDNVVVLDNLSTGFRDVLPKEAVFIQGDVSDRDLLDEILQIYGITAIIHFAAGTIISESEANPGWYFQNNAMNTLTLLAAAKAAGVKKFVFSSTAAVYGEVSMEPVKEDTPTRPISPYGWSKLISENMILDMAKSDDFNAVILRYFNVAGADMGGRTGQKTKNATLLIKIACEVATGKRPCLEIFGNDYPTPDGTGVRDYIHVNDLVDAHICALDFLAQHAKTMVMNCGYGHGSSVIEVVDCVERVLGKPVQTKISPRRAGDAASVIANPERIQHTLDWAPQFDDLDVIVRSALEWEKTLEGEKQV